MKIRRAKEQSIKVKTDSIKLAGVQGAKSATRQIEGGQEVLDAAMTAYVISKPERAVAKHGTKLVKKKVKENKDKPSERKEKQKGTERNRDKERHKSHSDKKTKNTDSGKSDKEHKKSKKRGIKKLIHKAQLALLLKSNSEKENQNGASRWEMLLIRRIAIPTLALLGLGLLLVTLVALPAMLIVALIYNSPFAIFFPPLESGDTVQSVTSAYVADFDREVSDLEIQHLGYDRGEIVYVGHEDTDIVPTNYYDILAVYMVKHGMGEAATVINDTTKGWIETVVDDMCDYTLSDGTEVTVNEDGTEVSQTVLYINVKLKSYEDMIFVYGFNEEKVKIAGQIKMT